jgi:hypothetical protein
MSRLGEIKDRLQRVVESDREDLAAHPDGREDFAKHPDGEDVTGGELSSLSERFHRNLALIRAYETRDSESHPNRPGDSNQPAKSIIDIATGEAPATPPDDKDPAAVQQGLSTQDI